jgi:hypothetical protein
MNIYLKMYSLGQWILRGYQNTLPRDMFIIIAACVSDAGRQGRSLGVKYIIPILLAYQADLFFQLGASTSI